MRHAEVRREMTALVRRWPSSRDTQAAFAARAGISRPKLRYWLRRVCSINARPPSIDFARVQVIPATGIDGRVEIMLAGGDRVLVPNGISADTLQTVIRVLRGSC